MSFILSNPDFAAEIFYLLPSDGGRQTTVSSGYRGQLYYDGKNWDASQQFLNRQFCEPGETVNVLIQTATPSNHLNKLFVGKRFEIREGSNVVGIGVISKLLSDQLQKRSISSFEKQVIEQIIRKDSFGITAVNRLDNVKSIYFSQPDYSSISQLVKQRKWYTINNDLDDTIRKSFREYLYVEVFADQDAKEYAAMIYDSDELWQDPEIIEIIPLY